MEENTQTYNTESTEANKSFDFIMDSLNKESQKSKLLLQAQKEIKEHRALQAKILAKEHKIKQLEERIKSLG